MEAHLAPAGKPSNPRSIPAYTAEARVRVTPPKGAGS